MTVVQNYGLFFFALLCTYMARTRLFEELVRRILRGFQILPIFPIFTSPRQVRIFVHFIQKCQPRLLVQNAKLFLRRFFLPKRLGTNATCIWKERTEDKKMNNNYPFTGNQTPVFNQIQQIQQMFPQPQGSVYSINAPAEIGNVPIGSTGLSVAICIPENLMYIKSFQNG